MAIIETKNLTKVYSDGETQTMALAGVSFKIEAGELPTFSPFWSLYIAEYVSLSIDPELKAFFKLFLSSSRLNIVA